MQFANMIECANRSVSSMLAKKTSCRNNAKKTSCRNNAKASTFSRDSYTTAERSRNRNGRKEEQCDFVNIALYRDDPLNKELCDNLEEVLPLIETFMGNNEKSAFTHRASPVYTPTPPREKYAKKAMGTPTSLKSSRRCKSFYQSPKKDASSNTAGRLNLLRRFEGERTLSSPFSCTPAFDNELEIIQDIPDSISMKNQIDGLEKSGDKDSHLKSMEQLSMPAKQDGEGCAELIRLQKKVEELEKLLAEKNQESVSARLEVEEKQNEIAEMKLYLQTVEGNGLKADENTRIYVLNDLSCQVAALRYQLESADSRSIQKLMEDAGFCKCCLPKDVKDNGEDPMLYCNGNKECCVGEEYRPEQTGNDKKTMELARRQYFAALIAARDQPGEESLVLAAGLRKQLESFLAIPSFATVINYPLRAHALSN